MAATAATAAAAERAAAVAAQQARTERVEREARQHAKLRKNIEDRLDAVSDQLVRLEDCVLSGSPLTESAQAALDHLTDELDLMTEGQQSVHHSRTIADRRRKLSRRVKDLYAKAIMAEQPEPEPEPAQEPEPGSGLIQLCGLAPASLTATTVIFPEDFVTVGTPHYATSGKIFYEVELSTIGSFPQFGWATTTFDVLTHHSGLSGVGDDNSSWGIDGARQQKWSNGPTNWGEAWEVGDTIGFAADLATGELNFGRNGNWEYPMGVAFVGVQPKGGLSPALSAKGPTQVVVNLGDRPWSYGPPDDTYVGMMLLKNGITLHEWAKPPPLHPEIADAIKQLKAILDPETTTFNISTIEGFNAILPIIEKPMATLEKDLAAAVNCITVYNTLIFGYAVFAQEALRLGVWDKCDQFCARACKMLDLAPVGSPAHNASMKVAIDVEKVVEQGIHQVRRSVQPHLR